VGAAITEGLGGAVPWCAVWSGWSYTGSEPCLPHQEDQNIFPSFSQSQPTFFRRQPSLNIMPSFLSSQIRASVLNYKR
jgi:hypothetical protein